MVKEKRLHAPYFSKFSQTDLSHLRMAYPTGCACLLISLSVWRKYRIPHQPMLQGKAHDRLAHMKPSVVPLLLNDKGLNAYLLAKGMLPTNPR